MAAALVIFVCSAVFALAPLAAFLSLLLAFTAAFVPHHVMLHCFSRQASATPFAFWAIKFMVTIGLLLQSLRLLQDNAALFPAYYIGGVVVALLINIAAAAHYTRRTVRSD